MSARRQKNSTREPAAHWVQGMPVLLLKLVVQVSSGGVPLPVSHVVGNCESSLTIMSPLGYWAHATHIVWKPWCGSSALSFLAVVVGPDSGILSITEQHTAQPKQHNQIHPTCFGARSAKVWGLSKQLAMPLARRLKLARMLIWNWQAERVCWACTADACVVGQGAREYVAAAPRLSFAFAGKASTHTGAGQAVLAQSPVSSPSSLFYDIKI